MNSWNALARPSAAFAGLDPRDAASVPRRNTDVALWRRAFRADHLQFGGPHIEKSPTPRNGPLHNRYAECAHTSLVEDVHHLRPEHSPGPHRRAGGVRGDLVSGDARVHDAGADAARRSPHLVLELLCHHAAAILSCGRPALWTVLDLDSGARVHLCSDKHRDCRRYVEFSGAL